MRRDLSVIVAGFLMTIGCGKMPEQGKNASLMGLADAEVVEPLEDGGFNVTCSDGSQQIVSQLQMSKGEVCVTESPLPIDETEYIELCGTYKDPVHFKRHRYLITCDVRFENKAVLTAGAKIDIDDDWDITFSDDVYAFGEKSEPIVFSMSENSTSVHANNFAIYGTSELAFKDGREYLSGTILKHVSLPKVQQTLTLSKVFATDILFSGQRELKVISSLVSRSKVNTGLENGATPKIRVKDESYFLHNEVISWVNRPLMNLTNSLFAWNSLELSEEISIGNKASFTFYNYINSIVAFNNSSLVINETRHGRTMFFNNSFQQYNSTYINPELKPVQVLNGDSQDENAILVTPFPLFQSKELSLEEEFGHQILSLDKNGWKFDKNLQTTLKYRVDGSLYTFGKPVTGYFPKFSIDKKESYFLDFSLPGVDASVLFPEIRLNVYEDKE